MCTTAAAAALTPRRTNARESLARSDRLQRLHHQEQQQQHHRPSVTRMWRSLLLRRSPSSTPRARLFTLSIPRGFRCFCLPTRPHIDCSSRLRRHASRLIALSAYSPPREYCLWPWAPTWTHRRFRTPFPRRCSSSNTTPFSCCGPRAMLWIVPSMREAFTRKATASNIARRRWATRSSP